MEPIYVGDLLPSIASYKKIIEKYDKGIKEGEFYEEPIGCLLYTSPSPRDPVSSRMPSSA